MAERNKYRNSNLQEEQTKRQERAERILDATAALMLRWGYRKTSIDDIARQAGVAKGTIYLHWRTRQDLFEALFLREYLTMIEEFQQHLLSDPENTTLHGIIKQIILVAMTRPLIKAMLIGDSDMLGEFAQREYADPTSVTVRRFEMGKAYIELFRSKGLIRTDMSIQEQIHVLAATAWGFLVADQFLPDQFKLSPEQSAELLAKTIHRTFEPAEPASSEKLQEVHAFFMHYLNQLIDAVKERSQKEIKS